MRGVAGTIRASAERVLDKGIRVFIRGAILMIARYPADRDGPTDRDARLIHGYFGKGLVEASSLQGNESTEAMTNEKGRAGLLLQSEHILALFRHAVIIALWAALTSPATLDDVDRKMLGQSAREGSVVGSHEEGAGNNQNRWPTSHGEIANLRPILGEHGVGGFCGCTYLSFGHLFSFFI